MKNLARTSLYISRDVSKWKERADLHYENISSCNSIVVKNGYLLPIKKLPAMPNEANGVYAGGVQSEDGRFIAGHRRAFAGDFNLSCNKTYALDEKQRSKAVLIEEDVVYGGMVIDIFGHVLAEAFSRLWYILEHDEEKNLIAFVAKNEVPKYFFDFMELLHIDRKRIVIVGELMKCQKIIVPEQAYIMYSGYNSKICDIYKTMMVTAQKSQNIVTDS